MKPQSAQELDLICDSISTKSEFTLSQVYFDQEQLGLCLNSDTEHTIWLWVDLRQATFAFLKLSKPLELKKSKIKPLYTFLKTHGLGKQLTRIERDKNKGRVILIAFENLNLELRMVKTHKNIIAHLEDQNKKPVSLYKVAVMPPNAESTHTSEPRSIESMASEWVASQISKKVVKHNTLSADESPKPTPGEAALKSKLQKLEQSIAQIKKSLTSDESEEWQAAGDWLKQNPKEKPPLQFLKFISTKKSFSQNLDHIFTQAKKLKQNYVNSQNRLKELEHDLEKLKAIKNPDEWLLSVQSHKRKISNKVAAVPHKQLRLSSGHAIVIGRSAKNNLEILRASQPWDLWLHLKDYPSAHGVIEKNKSEVLSDAVLHEAAKVLIEHSFKKKLDLIRGDKFVVITAEKRFVKPIKGSIGLVEYQSEKTFTLKY